MNDTAKTILIADDDKDLLEVLTHRCKQLGLDVIDVEDALTALSSVDFVTPDIICLDVEMPCGNGLAVCEMLASDEKLSSIPVIILTGKKDDETIRRCHNLAAYYVPKCTNVWTRLEPLLCELLEIKAPRDESPHHTDTSEEVPAVTNTRAKTIASGLDLIDRVFDMLGANFEDGDGRDEPDTAGSNRPEDPPWVLCIEDDHDFSETLKLRLESHGISVVTAFEGMEGYRTAFSKPADAIILDYNMPNGQGDYVLRRLKENPVTSGIPVIVLTGKKDGSVRRTMLNLGADAFLNKPLNFEELLENLGRYIDIPNALSGSSR